MKSLSPTVIPAQPGFKVAIFEPIGGHKISEKSRPEHFEPHFEPIIAWIITPAASDEKGGTSDGEVIHADVVPVVVGEASISDEQFVVTPDGNWIKERVQNFRDKTEACRYWIDSQIHKA